MDEDLDSQSREQLISTIKTLRAAIREHRDSTGHELCWHHPKLWSLLPEPWRHRSKCLRGLSSCGAVFATASPWTSRTPQRLVFSRNSRDEVRSRWNHRQGNPPRLSRCGLTAPSSDVARTAWRLWTPLLSMSGATRTSFSARRHMSLRSGADRDPSAAAHAHQLQLLHLPKVRRSLGVLPGRVSPGPP